ncbi:CaiB/BaiF CoA-transferase family protein [Amycolatopsis jejuensis]|uniref:CaiB/BaiF CoA-transferase family protein n=1 Tax=Amycolatopsis jejuensis TaxID=330084 RepID=UPI000527E10B|nr:CoA transferase [Amycolatopsis jejuensis]
MSGRLLRVVELADGIAGRVCGRLFAGFGHHVTRCEPPGGDPLRTQRPVDATGVSYTFATLNAGKHGEPVDRLDDLLACADVLITDFGPARAVESGLSLDRFPHLVVVSITPYGADDSRSDTYGDSLLAECHGGLAVMVGEPTRPPLSLGGEQTAHAAAFAAFYGAMLALRRPGGDVVDVALCDVAAYIDWKSDVFYAETGQISARIGTNSGRWRLVRAADGWVGFIYQPEQWDAVVQLVGDPVLADPRLSTDQARSQLVDTWWPAVERWAARNGKREIYRRAQELGLPFGYSADISDLVTDPQYRARGFVADHLAPVAGLPWNSEPTAEVVPAPRQHRPAPDGSAPLSGVVVLDLGTITAGAATGRLLADYGATVIKIESMTRPDAFRVWPVPNAGDAEAMEESPLFESNNSGKLGITLDLKTEAGKAELRRLVARSDVLIENFTVGVTQRLGIDYPTLAEINPRLIYLSLSSQGQSGPESGTRSYGSTLDLMSGLASVTGYPGDRPMWSSADINYPDQVVSLFGAAVVAYCVTQELRGTYLDVSQRELVSWTLADRIAEYVDAGTIPEPTGNRRPGSTPHEVYPCAGPDQWVAIVCRTDAQRAALAALVGSVELADRPPEWWEEHHEEVDGIIAGWTRSQSVEECLRELTQGAIPVAPVRTARERAEDPHFRRRRVFLDEPRRQKGFPFRLHGYEPPQPQPAPRIGQHDADLRTGQWPPAGVLSPSPGGTS